MSASLVQRAMRELYSPPAWLLPNEEISFLVTIDDWDDALNVQAHMRDVQTGEDRYACEPIAGQLLRIYSRDNGAMVNHLGFVMDLLTGRLKPKRCRDHDDCRECVALGEECWATSPPSSNPPESKR